MLLMPRSIESPSIEPYSVPRCFGIGSILMMTVAFAMVFTALRLMGFGLLGVLGTTVFLFAVGVAQSLNERTPREASIITGSLLFPTFAVVGWALESNSTFTFFSNHHVVLAVVSFVMLAPLGMMFGYFAGLLLATVFMFIDMLTSAAFKRGHATPDNDEDTDNDEPKACLTASETTLDDRRQTL